MSDTLVNRIANSGLITLRPEEWIPDTQVASFDLKDFLFKGLILKEQDFRESIKVHDWEQYLNKVLCVFCSADAIIPSWAYMLVAASASNNATEIFYGTPQQWTTQQLLSHIDKMNAAEFNDQKVIIKGCSDDAYIGPEIYVALTHKLVPVVKTLMFGEPCSTVPVFKRRKES
jgi:hypothetical protein